MQIRLVTLGQLRVLLDGSEFAALASQPVRAALLVYLAVERRSTREAVMACLWPERDERRARHALSQTLYELRRSLGEEWIEARGEALTVTGSVGVDLLELARAVRAGRHAEALELYAGPFLEGWHLVDSVEFEDWVDERRAEAARLHRTACREHAAERAEAGDLATAVSAARQWVRHEPLAPEANHLLITRLAERGDYAEARRSAELFARRLERAGLEPRESTRELFERVERLPAVHDRETAPEGAAPDPGVPRLVVLPFENLGPDERLYFTEGVTDELTSRLSRVAGLAVIARTSALRYRKGEATIETIGRDLAVDYVLEGAVRWDVTPEAARVRVSPQLIRVADATHVWAEVYEAGLDDVFGLQAEIAEQVAAALSVRLPERERGRARAGGTEDLVAYDWYLLGRHHWKDRTPEGLERAGEHFRRAIDRDPEYALAWAGLADSWGMRPAFAFEEPRVCFPRAKEAVSRALELEEDLAEAHATAGLVAMTWDWEWTAAEVHHARAIELDPNYAQAYVWYAYVLCLTGRLDAARRIMDRGFALDPLSVATNWDRGYHGWLLGDRERATEQIGRLLELAPGFWPGAFFAGALRHGAGDREGARALWLGESAPGAAWRKMAAALCGPDPGPEAVDRWVDATPPPIYWYVAAILYALVGAGERVLFWLETHLANLRGPGGPVATAGANLAYVSRDPFFDGIRGDPRFDALLAAMDLQRRPDIPS